MGESKVGNDGPPDVESIHKLLLSYENARKEGFAPKNPELEELLHAMKGEEMLSEHIHVPGINDAHEDTIAEEITPEPFYVVKSSDVKGQKVFINMCGCAKIAALGEWKNGIPSELEESFSSVNCDIDQSSQNLRLSLSCSDPVSSTDNRGEICQVYDVVFNLSVIRHSMVHKRIKVFVINMAITWINKKYGIDLKQDFKLPNMKYKGVIVRRHYIRSIKPQLVTEIPDAVADLQPSFPLLIGDKKEFPVQEAAFRKQSICNKYNPGKEPDLLREKIQMPLYNEKTIQNDEASSLVASAKEHSEALSSFISTHSDKESKDELESLAVHQNPEVLPITLSMHQPPPIQVQFIGHPVELVIAHMFFPSVVEAENLRVSASNREIYVEARSYNLIMIPLLFATAPLLAKASFFSCQSLLKVYLPFFPYSDLIKRACTWYLSSRSWADNGLFTSTCFKCFKRFTAQGVLAFTTSNGSKISSLCRERKFTRQY